MYKVSVIIPVYNVEKYLDRCLQSVVKQTIDELQVIIVNDGTKDQSQTIIDQYVNQYPHIVESYYQDNAGLSAARNTGLKYATGEYVAFVDSDDYIEEGMYKTMYQKAKEKDFDLVVSHFNEVREKGITKCSSRVDEDIFGKEAIKDKMIDFYPSAWNKLYKRSLLEKNQVQFKKGVWFEDVEFIYRLLPFVESIGTVNNNFYQYVIREGSITSTNDMRIYHYIDNWNGVLQFYKEQGLYEEYKEVLEYCYVRYLFATFIKTATKFDKVEYGKAVSKAIQNVREKFPYYKQNKYIRSANLKNLYLQYFTPFIASAIYFKSHR